MPNVDRAVRPLLDCDFGPGDADGTRAGLELVDSSVIADSVVVGYFAGGLGTQDGAQVEPLGNRSEGWVGVSRFDSEASGVLGDEDPIEVVGGFDRVGDVVVVEFCYQPVLERAVDPFTPAAGLRAVGEDEFDGKRVHSDLEVGRFIVTLEDMGTAMAGGSKLAGVVEVECSGQAMTSADLMEDAEATIERFLRIELAVEWHAGGVIGGEDESCRWKGGAKPGMRAAVDEDELAEACPAFSSASVVALRAMAMLGRDTGGTEPTADGIGTELDSFLFGEGLGEVAGVVLGELGLIEVQNLLAEACGFGVMRLTATVAMADALIARDPDLGLEPEDLARAQPQHWSCGPRRESGKRLADDGEPFHFRLREEYAFRHVTSITPTRPIPSI